MFRGTVVLILGTVANICEEEEPEGHNIISLDQITNAEVLNGWEKYKLGKMFYMTSEECFCHSLEQDFHS